MRRLALVLAALAALSLTGCYVAPPPYYGGGWHHWHGYEGGYWR